MSRDKNRVSTEPKTAITTWSLWALYASGSARKEGASVLSTMQGYGCSHNVSREEYVWNHRIHEDVFWCIHGKWVITAITAQGQSSKVLRCLGDIDRDYTTRLSSADQWQSNGQGDRNLKGRWKRRMVNASYGLGTGCSCGAASHSPNPLALEPFGNFNHYHLEGNSVTD